MVIVVVKGKEEKCDCFGDCGGGNKEQKYDGCGGGNNENALAGVVVVAKERKQ